MQFKILTLALVAASAVLAVPVVPKSGCFWDPTIGEEVCPGGPIITEPAPVPSHAPREAIPRGVGPVCPDGVCPITCHTKFGC